MLKIDRTEPRELVIVEETACHSREEIARTLEMVNSGNSAKVGQKVGSGFNRVTSAYGIVGKNDLTLLNIFV